MNHPKTLLLVLDGFGIGKSSPFNAIENAKMPFYRQLMKKYPHSEILTHGPAVGLPEGVMGNSEVGHMTMGAGRIIYQDLVRIHTAIQDKSFFKNKTLRATLEAGAKKTGQVHLMGLLSDGGVHSHIQHLFALLDLCLELKIPKVSVHAILDGRDTQPDSGVRYLQQLSEHPAFANEQPHTQTRLTTVMGRYYAMDRDQRWERIDKALNAMTGKTPAHSLEAKKTQTEKWTAILDLLHQSYSEKKMDEFVEPVLLEPSYKIQAGDSLVFFNYRADRARQITQKLIGNPPVVAISAFAGMTLYDQSQPNPAAFAPQSLNNIFAECLEQNKLRQLRVAETEKYAHVTFFFNAGREKPFQLEDRVLIPSAKEVATYDLKPEMSAFAIADAVAERLKQSLYDFTLVNFANADMVGHTGNYESTIRAMETLDRCLEKVIGTAEKNNCHVLVTADHGNAEEMVDCDGKPHTQHTLNPVPLISIAPGSAIAPKKDRKELLSGGLGDIMPTLCDLMQIEIPSEVTGKSLIP